MSLLTRAHGRLRFLVAGGASALVAVFAAAPAYANVALTQLSSDPYTNTTSFHQTEVEPDTLSFGSTEVSAFQVGRFQDGGSSNIGFATSTNGGSSWTNGFLPSLTVFSSPAGPYDRATDPAVAYDPKHGVWLISSLGLVGTSVVGQAVVASRSTDGLTWGAPVVTANASGSQNFDKNWIVCDTHSASPFYGNCYQIWDDHGAGNLLDMSTSTDGGLTWGPIKNTSPQLDAGIGEQPLVQPNGNVIVPLASANESAIGAYMSTNGGSTWTDAVTITSVKQKTDPGNLRSGALPSAEIDASGKVYLVWRDCRFQTGCKGNDIVMTTSTNGTSWTSVTRVTNDGTGVDHTIPGIGVDVTTSGSTAHIGVTYYYFAAGNTTQINVGYRSSVNGGSTWSAQTQLDGPITLTWLPNTSQGYMVGDYISTSILNGRAYPVFAHANAPLSNGTLQEYMVTPTGGLGVTGGAVAATSAGAAGVAANASINSTIWDSQTNSARTNRGSE
jgi:hypothetical protein